jgi:methylthioribulose-1-phosphate dehydratase
MLVGLSKAPLSQPRQDQSIKDPVPSPFHNHGPNSEASVEVLGQTLSLTMAEIHRRGWCDGTGGNFSCVLRREPLELLMAPSGVDKGSVRPGDLIVVDGSGGVIRGEGKASAETLLHLEIVAQSGAGAVLHTHSQAGTLLSRWLDPQKPKGFAGEDPETASVGTTSIDHASTEPASTERASTERASTETASVAYLHLSDLEMLKGLAGVGTHQTMVKVPVLANDQDLARLSKVASPHLEQAPHGLLIAGHGLYAWGKDLGEAKRHLEIHEFLLEQHWRQLQLQALLGGRGEEGAKR